MGGERSRDRLLCEENVRCATGFNRELIPLSENERKTTAPAKINCPSS